MLRLDPRQDLGATAGSWYPPLPTSWRSVPGRALFAERKQVGHVRESLLSVTIARGVVPQAEYLADGSKKDSSNLDKSKYKLVEPGDLAYNKMRAWQGAVGLARHRGIVSPAYVVMRPRAISARYAELLMRTPSFAKEAERWSYGITSDMWSLRPEHFKMIYFPLPPVEEQAAIVKYLGHAHARIDKAIAAKRKLIALLEEQKQAIIHQAVTRGLDPDVPLKDSGIPWLGNIPAHWESERLCALGRLRSSTVDKVPVEGEKPVRICNYVDVYRNTYIDDDLPLMQGTATASEVARFNLRAGDVLITKDSEDWRDIGVPALVTRSAHDVVSGYHLTLIRPDNSRLEGEWLLRCLQSKHVAVQLHTRANGVTRFGLSQVAIRNLLLPIPPAEEQRHVCERLRSEERHLLNAQQRSHREIELLREFRTRLTSDVVTGQVDVREIAATLPELTDEFLANEGNFEEDSLEDIAEEFLEGESD